MDIVSGIEYGVEALHITVGVESVRPRRSFKDVLLAPVAVEEVVAPVAFKMPVEKPTWQPTFQVVRASHLKVNRLYGTQPDVINDYEDDGLWDIIDSCADVKGRQVLTRARSISMLTPMQQEKKALRVAAKTTNASE